MFAFFPTPSEPPAWLEAARVACFGTMANGLPDVGGWLLLILAPLSFLVGIYFLWAGQIRSSVAAATLSTWGKVVVVVAISAVALEASWIAKKIKTARAVANWAQAGPLTDLDENYPIGTELAPEFKLVNEEGQLLSISQYKGQPLLLTFAFAHCQSMCPTVIESAKSAIANFPNLPFLIVTLDPWRDTPSLLSSLKEQWKLDARSHVLSSKNVEDVVATIKKYKVPFDRSKSTGDVVHPGLVFLIDSGGRIAYTFNNPPSTWIREGIRRIVEVQTQGAAHGSSQKFAQSL